MQSTLNTLSVNKGKYYKRPHSLLFILVTKLVLYRKQEESVIAYFKVLSWELWGKRGKSRAG